MKALAAILGSVTLVVFLSLALLQIPSVDDEFRCYITHTFYEPHQSQPPPSDTSVVSAYSETKPVQNKCDAADDPAIWINPDRPEQSLVVGTNKRRGLNVYNLEGHLLSENELGAINNVDIRQWGDWVLIGASNKGTSEIHILELNAESGELTSVLQRPINTKVEVETYGFCFYLSPEDDLYAIATDKSGQIEQWRIDQTNGGSLVGTFERTLRVATQPEGCVADDNNRHLYVGEEDIGVWKFEADPNESHEGKLIAKAGRMPSDDAQLISDVEGISIYHKPDSQKDGYLIVSSQGNDSYVLFDREAPHAFVGRFQISYAGYLTGDTDGLDVSASPAGPDFPEGVLVVQDGAPAWSERGNQNFKIVSWTSVKDSLQKP